MLLKINSFFKNYKNKIKSTFLLIKKRINKIRRHKIKAPPPAPAPIQITWLFSPFSIFIGSQTKPSPEYPSLHVHVNPPWIGLHVASEWHPPAFVRHSSITIEFV